MNKKLLLWIIVLLGLVSQVLAINATSSNYDLTNSSTSDTVFGFMWEVNVITGQWFFIGMLFVSFAIIFVSFLRQGTSDAFLGAGFITTIITILFTTLDLVPITIATVIFVAYGVFFAYRVVKG